MTLPLAIDIAKTEVIGVLGGFEVVNIFHSFLSGGSTAAQLAGLNTAFSGAYTATLMPGLSDEYEITNIISTDIGVVGGDQVNEAVSIVGGDSDPSLPANVALVVSWRTGHAGRSYRGRSYIPGIPAHLQVSPQTVDPSAAALLSDFADDLLSRVTASGYELVVLSYFTAGAPRVTPLYTPITTAIVNVQLDTQRKRLKQ